MTKELIALLLVAAMMLMAFAACDKDDGPTGGGTNASSGGGTNAPGGDGTQAPGGDETQGPADTQATELSYQPDLECPYNGYVGIGIEAGKAYFDDMRVVDQGAKMTLLDTDFEDTAAFPEFHALGSTDAVVPTQVDCPVQVLNEKEITNHAIEISEPSTYMNGDKIWNYYQYRVKVMPADNDTILNVYFAVTDENNYYVLTLGENGNTAATCYKVTDGNKENAQFTIGYTLDIDSYTPIGITLQRDFAQIFIAGNLYLEIGNDALPNDYFPYTGTADPVPLSVVDESTAYTPSPFGGAPGENVDVVYVEPENVIHDGLGTWNNALTTVATMVFDHDLTTYYDADAGREYQTDVDGELPGIPGDKTDENGYVGAYFPEGINLYAVRYAPRPDGTGTGRMGGGTFEVSTDGVNWTVFHTIEDAQTEYVWHTALVGDQVEGPVNYVRYHSPSGGYCNIAEMEIWVTK